MKVEFEYTETMEVVNVQLFRVFVKNHLYCLFANPGLGHEFGTRDVELNIPTVSSMVFLGMEKIATRKHSAGFTIVSVSHLYLVGTLLSNHSRTCALLY